MSIRLDFTNVESSSRMSAGTHRVTVSKVEAKKAQSGNDMLAVTYKNGNGDLAYDNFVLLPQALWKLKLFLEAVFNAPITGAIDLDPARLVNRSLIIEVNDENYIKDDGSQGTRARVETTYKPISVSDTLVTPPTPVAPTQPVTPMAPVTPAPVAPAPVAEPIVQAPVTPAPTPAPAQVQEPVSVKPKFPWEK